MRFPITGIKLVLQTFLILAMIASHGITTVHITKASEITSPKPSPTSVFKETTVAVATNTNRVHLSPTLYTNTKTCSNSFTTTSDILTNKRIIDTHTILFCGPLYVSSVNVEHVSINVGTALATGRIVSQKPNQNFLSTLEPLSIPPKVHSIVSDFSLALPNNQKSIAPNRHENIVNHNLTITLLKPKLTQEYLATWLC